MFSQMARFHTFLWLSNVPLYICTTVSLCIHVSVDTGCLHILVIVNIAVINIGMHMSFQINVLGFFGKIPRSGIAGSFFVSCYTLYFKVCFV